MRERRHEPSRDTYVALKAGAVMREDRTSRRETLLILGFTPYQTGVPSNYT